MGGAGRWAATRGRFHTAVFLIRMSCSVGDYKSTEFFVKDILVLVSGKTFGI
jgi:hypothetical protein